MNNKLPISPADDLSILVGKEMQNFIFANEYGDEKKLVLKHKKIQGASAGAVADQIAGRRKARIKLPRLYQTTGILYPPQTNLEQCSSEFAARHKARFVSAALGRPSSGIDLTTGFGIDSFFLSRICTNFTCVETDATILRIAGHNHALLGATNIDYHVSTAEDFLSTDVRQFDFGFVDPSRRNQNKRVFKLKDCAPDVISLLPHLLKRIDHILLKTSPLLDVQQGCSELGQVEKIIVVSVENECKEILFWCGKKPSVNCEISCVDLDSDRSGASKQFDFTFADERNTVSRFSDPLKYLYEPGAAVMKAGAFRTAGARFDLLKLQSNTHLYTSDRLCPDFPGRIFEILDPNCDLRRLAKRFPGGKVNVMTRNYPFTPDQLKKKFKLHDGGTRYLIGFSGQKRKFLAEVTRIK